MIVRRPNACAATALAIFLAAGCSSDSPSGTAAGNTPPSTTTAAPAPSTDTAPAQVPPPPVADDPLPPPASPYDALPESARLVLDRPFTGDLDEMVKRRVIRAGVVYNRTQYFIDKGRQRGMAYDALRLFEEELNKKLKTGKLTVHVAFVPLQRDQLFTALNEGKVDLVAAALTVTPEREKLATFSNPTRTGVSEIVVASKSAAPVATVDDLAGREVLVRRSSSYYESLVELNKRFAAAGTTPVTIKDAPEALEDDDLLEMVNAGLIDLTVVDDFIAKYWQQVFPDIRVVPDAAVRTGGSIAVGLRKDNPQILKAANEWIKKYGPRTAFGNMMDKGYLLNADYAHRAADEAERQKFQKVVELFKKYGDQYKLDYLLVAAQGYQESRLDHAARSRVGAIGVMQVMPATGKELRVGDIRELEPNIHAGVKYVRFMMDEYFKNEPIDELNKGLMTFAAYNAGPGRLRQLRREAAARNLSPNIWFGNVERIASERIGRETVQYVSNIYKYYIAYRLTRERADERARLKSQGTS